MSYTTIIKQETDVSLSWR